MWAHLLDNNHLFLISVLWETFFGAGTLTQTNSLGVPLLKAWGPHPIAIAMAVYPYAVTGTHTKHWQTANELTLCHIYQIRIKLLNSLNTIIHNGTALYKNVKQKYVTVMKNVSHYHYHYLTQVWDHNIYIINFWHLIMSILSVRYWYTRLGSYPFGRTWTSG